MDHSSEAYPLPLSYLTTGLHYECITKQEENAVIGFALIPVISMLLLLIIGYGIMGLRIEPLLLCSAAVAAGIAWWQGYCWEDIINSVVDKLAKAMPVIMILICVGGLIGTGCLVAPFPTWCTGAKTHKPGIYFDCSLLFNQRGLRLYRYIVGSAGTVGVALMGFAAGLDVSLAAAAGAVVSGAYFGDKISPLSDSTNFAAIVAALLCLSIFSIYFGRPAKFPACRRGLSYRRTQ